MIFAVLDVSLIMGLNIGETDKVFTLMFHRTHLTSYSLHLGAVSHVTKVRYNERQRKKWNYYCWLSRLLKSTHRICIALFNHFNASQEMNCIKCSTKPR